jgi:hypothetical protein
MPQQSQRSQQAADADARMLGELVSGVVRSVALSVEVFLHRGFGSGYVGCGPIAIGVIWVFVLHFQGQNVAPLLAFAGVYAVAWLAAAVGTAVRSWRRRDRLHTLYAGRPHLLRLVPRWGESRVKHLEGPAVVLLGWVVRHLNVPLGDYLMVAGSVVFLRVYSLAAQQRHAATAMHDRAIEQGDVAERFRDIQGP